MLISQVYATFEPRPQPHRRATSGDMLKALDDKQDGKDIIILDARGLEQYTGEASCLMSCQTLRLCFSIIHALMPDAYTHESGLTTLCAKGMLNC